MEIKYNTTGARRKELVEAISQITGTSAVYKGAPTFDYEIGDITVDKEGTLTIDGGVEIELVKKLMQELTERGFISEDKAILTIEMPLNGFTDVALENLKRLVASKETLIKKAVSADALAIEQTETTLKFPWFKSEASSNEVSAYTRFISAICAAAKEQKRVTAKERPAENEKYTFRCFLLRLGFIGDECKAERKVLLKRLSGNGAFKSIEAKQQSGEEVQDEQ
jgi:hypothetical protein